MDFRVAEEALTLREVLVDTTVEQPLESDMILPDYCPDVARLLKCELVPGITSRQLGASGLTVDGTAQLRVLYLTEEGTVHCAQSLLPFSKTIELKEAGEEAQIQLDARCDYLNCRVVSPRRLDIRGAIALSVRVWVNRPRQVVTGASGGGIQVRSRMLDPSMVVGRADPLFPVREELELPEEAPGAVSVIRGDATAERTDFKVVPGKVVVKGEAHITALYTDEAGGLQQAAFDLPISQIADLAGLEEDCVCDLSLSAQQVEMSVKTDAMGEGRVLVCSMLVGVHLIAHRTREIAAVTDAYSTAYETQMTTLPVTVSRLAQTVYEDFTVRHTFEVPGLAEICTLWAVPSAGATRLEEGSALLDGKLTCCLLGRDETGGIVYREYTGDFCQRIPLSAGCGELSFEPVLGLSAISATVGGGRVETKAVLIVSGPVYCETRETVVTELAVDETRPKHPEEGSALVLYFCDAGEHVWDIAKRYNTAPAAIEEENGLEDEVIACRGMLLIPSAG